MTYRDHSDGSCYPRRLHAWSTKVSHWKKLKNEQFCGASQGQAPRAKAAPAPGFFQIKEIKEGKRQWANRLYAKYLSLGLIPSCKMRGRVLISLSGTLNNVHGRPWNRTCHMVCFHYWCTGKCQTGFLLPAELIWQSFPIHVFNLPSKKPARAEPAESEEMRVFALGTQWYSKNWAMAQAGILFLDMLVNLLVAAATCKWACATWDLWCHLRLSVVFFNLLHLIYSAVMIYTWLLRQISCNYEHD